MTDGWFPAFFNFLHLRRRYVAVAVCVLLLFSTVGLFFIHFRHSMEVMLPSGSDTQKAISFLQNLNFSAKVALSFSKTDETLDRTEFFAAVDGVAQSINSPLIPKVLSTFDTKQMVSDIGAFLDRAPELLDEAELKHLGLQITREGVEQSLRKKYLQLLKPEGAFMGTMIRRDPLDIQMAMIEKIRGLSTSFGYAMRIENNHIVSADGKQVLLILETTVPFTDAKGSKELIEYINHTLETLPPSINVDVICGHLHTISNEKVIKRDIGLTGTITSIIFFLVFVFVFKDLRAYLIVLLPIVALLAAVNISAILLGTLSPMVLGLGSVVAGITVDYGVYIYFAVQRSNSALDAVRAIFRPIMFGTWTSAAVFVAFLCSSIPGCRQLGCFALLSVVFTMAGTLLVLPLYFIPKGQRDTSPMLKMQPKRAGLTVAVFAALLIVAVLVARQVRFNSDVMQLDGTEKAVLKTEEKFQKIWGSGGAGQAIAVVAHPDYETALRLNDRVYDTLVERLGRADVASLSPIWKSYSQRTANVARWNEFWGSGHATELKNLFQQKGAQFGFAPDAFDPFFQTLEMSVVQKNEPSKNVVFSQIKDRFIQHRDGETQLLTFFPDRPEYIKAMASVKDEIPGFMLISRSALSIALAHDYTKEFIRISIISLGLISIMTVFLMKNLRMILIVFAPACAGVASIAVLLALTGSSLNVMHLISGIIVIGLAVDYGHFYVHAYMHSLSLGTRTSITLNAGTALIGAGVLLFTHHPALFSVGLTLVGGISAGYATAMLVVPALCSLFLKDRR